VNILLAIDDSPYSQAALETVQTRPWPKGSHIKVITVVEPFHPEYAGWHTTYVPLAIEAQKELLDSARLLVERSVESLRKAAALENVSGEAIEGYIKDKILETAKNWPADLIIVGSHGRRGFTKFLLGSVSEAIASHSPCSVEIVKIKNHPQRAHLDASSQQATSLK
jgi:nucleotide-binding universal stress UspA family protein